MEINNHKHPGKVRGPAVTGKNYFVQEANAGAVLEDALADFVEAVTDAVEGMAKRKAAAKEGNTS